MKVEKREAKAPNRKKGRRGPDEYFVQLPHGLLDEPAWKALRPGARVLYVALKRYYNGQNNGRIFLSIRKAAEDTGLSRGSVERHLQELVDKGFIRPAVKGHLGVLGKGQATCWILTEIGVNGARPTKDFRDWPPPEKQNPVIKIGTGCHQNRDREAPKCHHHEDSCHHHEDRETPISGRPCHQNRDTSTYLHQGDREPGDDRDSTGSTGALRTFAVKARSMLLGRDGRVCNCGMVSRVGVRVDRWGTA